MITFWKFLKQRSGDERWRRGDLGREKQKWVRLVHASPWWALWGLFTSGASPGEGRAEPVPDGALAFVWVSGLELGLEAG